MSTYQEQEIITDMPAKRKSSAGKRTRGRSTKPYFFKVRKATKPKPPKKKR